MEVVFLLFVFSMHLPADDIPDVLDKLAVLHIDDCGDFVEKVHEVTPTHVRLKELAFFPRAVVMRLGTPVKVSCNVLLYYKPNTSFLKLHVYLVPNDPALQQVCFCHRCGNKGSEQKLQVMDL